MGKAKAWVLIAAATLVGLLAGVLLSRLLPVESKSNAAEGALPSSGKGAAATVSATKIATEFDPRNLLEKVATGQTVEAGWPSGASRVDERGGLSKRYDAVVYRLKDAKQGTAIADALQTEVEKFIESRKGTIFRRHDIGSGAGSANFRSCVRGYRLDGRSGNVLIWSTHHDDCLSMVVFFYEIEGEETVPAPVPEVGRVGFP